MYVYISYISYDIYIYIYSHIHIYIYIYICSLIYRDIKDAGMNHICIDINICISLDTYVTTTARHEATGTC